MTYTLISRMKIILLIAVLAICGFFAYRDWFAVPEPPTPAPTPAPTPQVRLAPDGVFFVVKAFSMQTDDGIRGFPILKEVRLVREEGDDLIVSDGQAEGRAPKANFTNDLDVVDRLRQALPPPAPMSVADNSPISLEIEKTSRDVASAEIELQRLESALKRTNFNISKTGERISRGEVYDGLTDLREVTKELQRKQSELEAKRYYWSEMIQKLSSYKDALEAIQKIDGPARNGAHDMARARQEASQAEAKARAALEAHRSLPLR